MLLVSKLIKEPKTQGKTKNTRQDGNKTDDLKKVIERAHTQTRKLTHTHTQDYISFSSAIVYMCACVCVYACGMGANVRMHLCAGIFVAVSALRVP